MRLSIFGFKGNISEKVLDLLNYPDSLKISGSRKDVQSFVNQLKTDPPKVILGLGEYSGPGKLIRVELKCSNKFRNNLLDRELVTLNLNEPVITSKHFIKTYKMGNSYCNLVSYLIKTKLTNTQYFFLHIPKKFDPILAASLISNYFLSKEL